MVLSEQACLSGEMPDAIGWKRACHSVLVECKLSRADFLADRDKPFRRKQEMGLGCERFYLTPSGLLRPKNCRRAGACSNATTAKSKSSTARHGTCALRLAFAYEMNLLLASLRRVEIRIEPQTSPSS